MGREAELRTLWKEAFGDTDEFLDIFFETAFSPRRCLYESADGKIVAALYWFDCSLYGRKIAYIYAVATLKSHQGKGLCHRLMERLHPVLKQQGYSGAILMPGEPSLIRFYQTMGYSICTWVKEFSCAAGVQTEPLQPICAAEYGTLRRKLLPAGGVIQEEENLRFLKRTASFYRGEDFILACTREHKKLTVIELLGNTDHAAAIVSALGCEEGSFRTPGNTRPLTMYLSLDGSPAPIYFGLPFD